MASLACRGPRRAAARDRFPGPHPCASAVVAARWGSADAAPTQRRQRNGCLTALDGRAVVSG